MALLSLRNVSKSFAQDKVVNNINLEIAEGEFIALLGPSGCGKSTILRMLAGFEELSEGSIYHGGACFSSPKNTLPPEERNFGMVFQSYALWPHMNVSENVGYPLHVKGIRGAKKRQRIEQALEVVQLQPFANRFPADLSGGQRQRVALARSLVTEPEVVLLDEPLANLDRHLRATMEETFRLFHRSTGATMVYVTHDQAEAMSLADKIAVLRKGELVQWGTPTQLYQQPQNTWLANFVGRGAVIKINGAMAGEICDKQVITRHFLESEFDNRLDSIGESILVRPQAVTINVETGIPATVTQCVFRGEHYDIELRLVDGQTLFAYHSQIIPIGTLTFVSIDNGWGLEQEGETCQDI